MHSEKPEIERNHNFRETFKQNFRGQGAAQPVIWYIYFMAMN